MDKRTRVLCAMDKKDVDHVPVAFWYHFSGSEAMGDECVQAHLNYYRETDFDFVKIMCDSYFPYPLPQKLESASDFYQMKPLGRDHPFLKEQVERAKEIVNAIGSERCVFYNVFAPFSSMRFGAGDNGDEKIMQFIREDKQAVMYALDIIGQDNALLCEMLIKEAGCDGVYYCVQGGEYGRFTPEEYHEIIRPSDLYVLEHANRYSQYNILHCCGWAGAKNQLELWKDYPVKVVNWAVFVEKLSPEDGRIFFGDRTSLCGYETLWDGTNHQGIIYTGTKEELQEYTRNLILRHGKRGLMLGGDCTIDASIDHERLKWVVEAARSL